MGKWEFEYTCKLNWTYLPVLHIHWRRKQIESGGARLILRNIGEKN